MNNNPMKVNVNISNGKQGVYNMESSEYINIEEHGEIMNVKAGGKGKGERWGKGGHWHGDFHGAQYYQNHWDSQPKGKGKGKDKGGGKGHKGKNNSYTWNQHGGTLNDKGSGKGKSRQCYRCGGSGHLQRDCPSPIQNIDEGYEEYRGELADRDKRDTDIEDDGLPCWSLQEREETQAWQLVTKSPGKKHAIQSLEKSRRSLKNRFNRLRAENIEEDQSTCINQIVEIQGDKIKLEMTLDSGAGDHVLPKSMFPSVAIKPTPKSISGRCFYDASGKEIPNEGEKKIEFITPGGRSQKIRWQVADIVQPLLSMGKMEEAGCIMNFSKGDRHVLIPATGERIPVQKRNGTYKLTLYVDMQKAGPVFSWQG